MKKLLICIICIFFCVPFVMYAAAPTTERAPVASVLQLIEFLQEQIQILERELSLQKHASAVTGSRTHTPGQNIQRNLQTIDARTQSSYYSGRYVTLYETDGYKLTPIHSDTINEDDEEIWETFVEIAGEAFVISHVTEFRIYNEGETEIDAFVEKVGKENGWVLGVNVYDLDLSRKVVREDMKRLLLHEFAHILFEQNPRVHTFENMFWDSEDYRHANAVLRSKNEYKKNALMASYFENHAGDFVSAYATKNVLEDVVESFSEYVEGTSPGGGSMAKNKVSFFGQYADFVAIKRRLDSIF